MLKEHASDPGGSWHELIAICFRVSAHLSPRTDSLCTVLLVRTKRRNCPSLLCQYLREREGEGGRGGGPGGGGGRGGCRTNKGATVQLQLRI